jgi:hypothetical protein
MAIARSTLLRRAALLPGLLLAAAGCDGKAGALARAEANDKEFASVPVPAADGPKIHGVRPGAAVYARPRTSAKKLGEIAPGAAVARSAEPVTKDDCKGGWYAVRPRGFVCAGPNASLDAGAARAFPGPDLARALPYRYGRARSENVPVYGRMPTATEQLAAEPDLLKHLGRAEDTDPLGAGANDVPLDARFAPTGPPVLLPGGEGIQEGTRTGASFFAFPSETPLPAAPVDDRGSARQAGLRPDTPAEAKVGALRKGSGVALAGMVIGDGSAKPRRFGITADGRLVPTDRLRPALGTVFHGIDLDKTGLPVAFVHKGGVHTFALQKGKAIKQDDELDRRAAVPLTGKFRTVEGVRFEETRSGDWLRAQDLVVVVKRHKFPDFVKGSQKWIDVSIANQTLTAYEGVKPIFATLVSSGRDQLKDPTTSAATARGTFQVLSKSVVRALDPRTVQNGFDVNDAPWVMEFAPGFAFAGTYWGDGLGEAQTFHDVSLSPIDAHRLWAWADPPLPEGWSSVEGADDGTTVFVRP